MWSIKTLVVCLVASTVSAFPAGFDLEQLQSLRKDDLLSMNPETAAIIARVEEAVREYRTNSFDKRQVGTVESQCGTTPCTTFDAAAQFVDVRPGTAHQFVAPTASDKRGPCPGLNAAANHGFIPHNGILTVAQAIDGLDKAYGLGADTSTLLATIGVLFTGDPIALTWSIGGPYPASLLAALLGIQPSGISNSHNNYEADSSVTRYDAYLNNGNAVQMNISSFKRLLSDANPQGLLTIDSLQLQANQNRQFSIENNPYFFAGPITGVIAAPAAHYLVVRMMSNHTADNPDGYLDADILKTIFGVTGTGDSLIWTPGSEQLPQNWYRRPSSAPYTIPGAVADVVAGALKYPQLLMVGGNTGTVDSFTGVDVEALTNGVYNAQSLLEGNNLACFILQVAKIGPQHFLQDILQAIAPVLNLLNGVLNPVISSLSCPALTSMNFGLYDQFPGASYVPPVIPKREVQ